MVISHEEEGPSSRLRTRSKRLFSALKERWTCDCDSPYEARFCIASCGGNADWSNWKDPSNARVTFEFLVSHPQSSGCEDTVVIESMSKCASEDFIFKGNI